MVVISALTDSLRLDGVGFGLVAIGLVAGFIPHEPKVVKITRRRNGWSDMKQFMREVARS